MLKVDVTRQPHPNPEGRIHLPPLPAQELKFESRIIEADRSRFHNNMPWHGGYSRWSDTRQFYKGQVGDALPREKLFMIDLMQEHTLCVSRKRCYPHIFPLKCSMYAVKITSSSLRFPLEQCDLILVHSHRLKEENGECILTSPKESPPNPIGFFLTPLECNEILICTTRHIHFEA